jgi:hypothetical protein
VPISGIGLSDWFHREAFDGGRRSRRNTPRSPQNTSQESHRGPKPSARSWRASNTSTGFAKADRKMIVNFAAG